jgi:CRP/FNR family cyclic AMP-dependent transcriptional regulator
VGDSRVTAGPQDRIRVPESARARSLASAAFAARDPRPWASVRLLDVEPDPAPDLSEAELAELAAFEVRALSVAPGPWSPPEALQRSLGIVVIAGKLVRIGRSFARADIQLLGPGDLADALSVSHGEWRALEPAQLAVLDERVIVAAHRWPALMRGFARRLFEAQQEQHARATICTVPRVEQRLLALFCDLAGRWGHVTPDGVTVTLSVTHEILGALIGARRPTVQPRPHRARPAAAAPPPGRWHMGAARSVGALAEDRRAELPASARGVTRGAAAARSSRSPPAHGFAIASHGGDRIHDRGLTQGGQLYGGPGQIDPPGGSGRAELAVL